MQLYNPPKTNYYFEVIGFTGTQKGMSPAQISRVKEILSDFNPKKIVHGDCIGADAQTHDIAEEMGLEIVIRPCTIRSKRAFKEADLVMDPIDPIERNKHIVEDSDLVLACPKEPRSTLRSGTWSAIRHAKRTQTPVWIIYPDGTEDKPSF